MEYCGVLIWGYMNIPNPPNYKMAQDFISKFPKFNGQPYYYFTDFYFPDFEMEIEKDKGPVSYKSFYINKYYDLLLSHLNCLSQKKKTAEARQELLMNSILKEEQYYQYSKKKKELQALFSTLKN